jgi:hypothetical protein
MKEAGIPEATVSGVIGHESKAVMISNTSLDLPQQVGGRPAQSGD